MTILCVRLVQMTESWVEKCIHSQFLSSLVECVCVFTRLHPLQLQDQAAASPGFCRATWHKTGRRDKEGKSRGEDKGWREVFLGEEGELNLNRRICYTELFPSPSLFIYLFIFSFFLN